MVAVQWAVSSSPSAGMSGFSCDLSTCFPSPFSNDILQIFSLIHCGKRPTGLLAVTARAMNRSRSISKRISGLWSPKGQDTPAMVPESLRVLPTDMFREIASHLAEIDILNLSSSSKELRTLLLPEIYATVSLLCGSRTSSSKLDMLSSSPNLWVYIRTLAIGPDWLSWPLEASIESWVAAKIEKICQMSRAQELILYSTNTPV
ncbi:hypothetical protein B0H13DRAFT_1875404 [Mycena leptocephala]|nr:hypothetical protein B0H13DRAFT_1875404 [Mycena leptocephala]